MCLVVLRHAVGCTFNAAPSEQDMSTMLAMSAVVVSVSVTLFCVHFKTSHAPIIWAFLAGDELENALIIAAWREAKAEINCSM